MYVENIIYIAPLAKYEKLKVGYDNYVAFIIRKTLHNNKIIACNICFNLIEAIKN